ncbi:hypothetical protein ACYCCF_17205 [Streptomyces argenteolus]|uniref:hypothetical protein n=1 Tax=Streptomyces sp. NPDC025273 TaxID=3155251 RepID=UPI0033E2B521
MADGIARFFAMLVRTLVPGAGWRRGAYVYRYTCAYVGGVTARCTGESPPRGEDSPLVRPYYLAYERERAARELAELRRRRVLVVATHGWGVAA